MALQQLSAGEVSDPSRIRIVAAFAAIYLFWGGTFLAIRYAVAELPPLWMIAIRCAGGALVLYAWYLSSARFAGERPERSTAAQWRVAALAGVFLFLGCHGVLAWAEQRVSSGQAALYLTSIPLSLVLLTALRERRSPSWRVLAGLGLGVLGIAVLTTGSAPHSEMQHAETGGTLADRLALVACGASWAVGSLIARHGARTESAVQSTAMQLAAGSIVVAVASIAFGELGGSPFASLTFRGVAAMAFLILCGTALGMAAFTWLLRVTTPAAVGTYAFVNPVIALLLAWAAGDEVITGRTLLAAVMVVGAVLLTHGGKK